MIHLRHMRVDYPSNINGCDINSSGNYARPDDVPTEMTFSIFRIKVSAVLRDLVDAVWDAGCDVEELPYDLVLDFDRKFDAIIAEVDNIYNKVTNLFPSRASMNSRGQSETPKMLYILTSHHRLILFCMLSRISRIHRPYLIRGSKDPRYAYSRMICLRSARTVIELGKGLIEQNRDFDALKICASNNHMFLSTIILVMDYCFNRNEPRAKERKEEILDCFRVLESSRDESMIARRGLQKLQNLLRDTWSFSERSGEGSASDIVNSEMQTSPNTRHPQSSLIAPISSTPHQTVSGNEASLSFFGYAPDPVDENQWPEFDCNALQNLDFDADVEASQFDAFFHSIDDKDHLF
jgi:hypothetical protein